MTSWYSLYRWSSISVSDRCRSSALTLLTLRPPSQEGRPAGGPHAQDGAADHRPSPNGAEDAAVRGIGPVVTHHPKAPLGDGDRRKVRGRRARRQVGLDQLAP